MLIPVLATLGLGTASYFGSMSQQKAKSEAIKTAKNRLEREKISESDIDKYKDEIKDLYTGQAMSALNTSALQTAISGILNPQTVATIQESTISGERAKAVIEGEQKMRDINRDINRQIAGLESQDMGVSTSEALMEGLSGGISGYMLGSTIEDGLKSEQRKDALSQAFKPDGTIDFAKYAELANKPLWLDKLFGIGAKTSIENSTVSNTPAISTNIENSTLNNKPIISTNIEKPTSFNKSAIPAGMNTTDLDWMKFYKKNNYKVPSLYQPSFTNMFNL